MKKLIVVALVLLPLQVRAQDFCSTDSEFISSFIDDLCGDDDGCKWARAQEFIACKEAETRVWQAEAERRGEDLEQLRGIQAEITEFAEEFGACVKKRDQLQRKVKRLTKAKKKKSRNR